MLGGLLSFALLVKGFIGFTDQLTRIRAPGETRLSLDQPGTYMIAYEYRSVVDGESISGPAQPPGMTIGVAEAQSETAVAVRSPGDEFSYERGSITGRVVAEFTVDRPGGYVIASRYNSGDGPPLVLAVGRSPRIGLAVGLGAVGITAVTAGVAILAVVLVRRHRARRRELTTW
jgi:hypothetical protein